MLAKTPQHSSRIRPIGSEQDDFSVEILKDLIAAGLSGDELIRRFALENKNIHNAIKHMTEAAERIASGEMPAATMDEVFGKDV